MFSFCLPSKCERGSMIAAPFSSVGTLCILICPPHFSYSMHHDCVGSITPRCLCCQPLNVGPNKLLVWAGISQHFCITVFNGGINAGQLSTCQLYFFITGCVQAVQQLLRGVLDLCF